MNKGTIILIPFPFADFSTTKVRPALCLTDPIAPFDQIVIAFISSNTDKDIVETEILLDPNEEWFYKTGLKVKSILKLHKLVTIEKASINKMLGEIPDSMFNDINAKLKLLFKID